MAVEEKVAKLSIIIDSSQATNATVSLEKLTEVGKSLEDQTKKVAEETRKASQPMKTVSETAKSTAAEFKGISKASETVSENIKKIGTNAPAASKAINEIGSASKTAKDNLDKATSSINNVGAASEKMNKTFSQSHVGFDVISDAVKKSGASFEYFTASSKDVYTFLENYNKKIKDIAPSVQVASDSIQKSSTHFNGYISSIKTAGNSVGTFSKSVGDLSNSTSVASESIKQASNEMIKAGSNSENAGRRIKSSFQDVKSAAIDVKAAMRDFASALLPAATVAGTVSGLVQIKNEAQDFQKSLAQVSTILDNMDQLGDIGASAKEAALEFGKLPTDQVKAFYDILSAGVSDVADAQKILIAGNKLATGGAADFNIATKGIISTLNSYGISASKVTDVTDSFFVAAKAGALSIESLSREIGNVASIANPAGVKLDELLSAVAALTNTGLSTSEAITAVRTALTSIITPASQAQKEANKIGLEFNATALKTKGFTKFLEEIKTKTKGSTESLGLLFGAVEGLTGVQALIGPAAKSFNESLDQMKVKSGATEVAFQKMTGTFAEEADKLTAKFALFRLEIGEKLLNDALPALKGINENFNQMADTFETLAKVAVIYTTALYGIPIASAAASRGMFVLTTMMQGYISSANIATTKTLTLQNALNVIAAGLIGWEIGTYLKNNFEDVEKAGIALAGGLHAAFIYIAGEARKAGILIEQYLTDPIGGIRNTYANLFENLSLLPKTALNAAGLGSVAEKVQTIADKIRGDFADKNKTTLDQIDQDTKNKIAEVGDTYADLFSLVGNKAEEAKKHVKNLNDTLQDKKDKPAKPTVTPTGLSAEEIKAQQKAAKELANEYDRIVDGLKKQIASSGEATEAEKMRYQISNSELGKLDAAQKKELMNYAEAIDKIDEITKKKEEQKKVDEEALQIYDRVDRTASIERQYAKERETILKATSITEAEKTKIMMKLDQERNDELIKQSDDFWAKWIKSAEENLQSFDKMSATVLDSFTSSFGDAIESMIFDSKSFKDAMASLAETMLRSIVNALAQMAAQWLAYQAVQLLVGKTTQASAAIQMSSNAYAMALQGGINAYASTAAIPVVGPVLAPAALATAEATLMPMATAVSSMALAGMAHDGIMNVPENGTWLLQKGERVTTQNTSKKLDKTLDQVMATNSGGRQVNQYFNIQTPDANSFRSSQRQIIKGARRAMQ